MEMYFIGEVRGFAGNFAPRSCAYCEGQLIAISSNDALFSILGTIYGGDGRTNFGLPDLRGRAALGQGNGSGLTNRSLGQKSGQQRVTLTNSSLPSHTHATASVVKGTSAVGDGGTAADGEYMAASATLGLWAKDGSLDNMQNGTATVTIQPNGGNQGHNNLAPYLGIKYIIQLFGTYPTRN